MPTGAYLSTLTKAREKGKQAKIQWSRQPLKGETNLWLASLHREHLAAFTLNPKKGEAHFLDADATAVFSSPKREMLFQTLNAQSPLQVIERIGFADRLTDGDARFVFEGCFINRSKGKLEKVELRATLLLQLKEGKRFLGRSGKPRHHTARSGIPQSVAEQSVFCTRLTSGKASKQEIRTGVLFSQGWLEASYETAQGVRRFLPIHRVNLDWERFAGKETKRWGVLPKGEYKNHDKKKGAIRYDGVSLVSVLSEKGGQCLFKDELNRKGIAKREAFLGLYPKTPPALDKKLEKLFQRFINLGMQPEEKKRFFTLFLPNAVSDSEKAAIYRKHFTHSLQMNAAGVVPVLLEARGKANRVMLLYFLFVTKKTGERETSLNAVGFEKSGRFDWRVIPLDRF